VDLDPAQLAKALKDEFSRTWGNLSLRTARAFINSAQESSRRTYEQKPIGFLCAGLRNYPVAFVALVPKRGGAVKALMFTETNDARTLHELVQRAEDGVLNSSKRKIYFLHPVDDAFVVRLLKQRGYMAEGILREPYAPGRDVIILSRLFD
jgi:hypothetical protein